MLHIQQISYAGEISVDMGKEVTPTQVQNVPITVEWPVEQGSYYTLCMSGNVKFKILVFIVIVS